MAIQVFDFGVKVAGVAEPHPFRKAPKVKSLATVETWIKLC